MESLVRTLREAENFQSLSESEARETVGDIVVAFSSFIQMRRFHDAAYLQTVIEAVRDLTGSYAHNNCWHPNHVGELFLTYVRMKHHLTTNRPDIPNLKCLTLERELKDIMPAFIQAIPAQQSSTLALII